MVLIGGEPGIGKTHLLGEVIARLPEFRVLRGQAREFDGGLAYAPLAGAFATLGEEAPRELAELYGAIDEAALGHSPVAPAVLAAQLLESLPGRTLVAIDDLHL